MLHPISTLPLSSRHRVSQILFHPTQPFLAIQTHDRSVEIFRVRSDDEIKKKQMRRKKREKEKLPEKEKTTNAMDAEEGGAFEMTDRFLPYLIIRANGKIRSFDFASNETNNKGDIHVRFHFLIVLTH